MLMKDYHLTYERVNLVTRCSEILVDYLAAFKWGSRWAAVYKIC